MNLAVRITGVLRPSQKRKLVPCETLWLHLPIWKLRSTSTHGGICLWSLLITLMMFKPSSWTLNSLEPQNFIKMSLKTEAYHLELSKGRGSRPFSTQQMVRQATGCFTNWESIQCHQSLETRIHNRKISSSLTAKCCKVYWKRTLSGSISS